MLKRLVVHLVLFKRILMFKRSIFFAFAVTFGIGVGITSLTPTVFRRSPQLVLTFRLQPVSVAANVEMKRSYQSLMHASGRAGLYEALSVQGSPRPINASSFVKIPAGEFLMGSANGSDSEKPAHRVVLSRGFEMGKYEVTQAQWEAVMRSNPSRFKGSDLPVEQVSWEDVQLFLQAMNVKRDGYVYRLPTEAEWEYAARARTSGDYGGSGDLAEMGWHSGNSEEKTHPVGGKKANAWGLNDMHGNVWEWCQDWYDKDYYKNSPTTDPQGPGTGSRRVCRGGGWSYSADRCKSASRAHPAPGDRHPFVGFRLVRVPK